MYHRQKTAFKYILDYSWVIPTKFPHEKHPKIDPKSINIEKSCKQINLMLLPGGWWSIVKARRQNKLSACPQAVQFWDQVL